MFLLRSIEFASHGFCYHIRINRRHRDIRFCQPELLHDTHDCHLVMLQHTSMTHQHFPPDISHRAQLWWLVNPFTELLGSDALSHRYCCQFLLLGQHHHRLWAYHLLTLLASLTNLSHSLAGWFTPDQINFTPWLHHPFKSNRSLLINLPSFGADLVVNSELVTWPLSEPIRSHHLLLRRKDYFCWPLAQPTREQHGRRVAM